MKRLIVLFTLALVGCGADSWGAQSSPSASTATDLIYLQDSQPSRLVGMDWSGKLHGTVSAEGLVVPSADGSRLLRWTGNAYDVEDSSGRPLGPLDLPAASYAGGLTWADDSRHVCAVAIPSESGPNAGQGWLWIGVIGETARKVGPVGKAGSDPGIAACSMNKDQAIVVGGLKAHWPPGATSYLITAEVQVVKLSTGVIEYERSYPLGNLGGQRGSGSRGDWVLVSASADGHYLAENALFSATTTIREIPGGTQVASVPGSVLGFSWDGTRVVVRVSSSEARLIAWADQRVLWHTPAVSQWVLARPNSSDLMVGVVNPGGGLNDLILVTGDGASTVLAHNAMVHVPCPCPGEGA